MAINQIDRTDVALRLMQGYRTATAQPSAPVNAAKTPPNQAQLQSVVQKLNDMMAKSNTSVEFSLDESAQLPVIKVIDKETNRVLRQLPNLEALAFAKNLDTFKGLLLNQRV